MSSIWRQIVDRLVVTGQTLLVSNNGPLREVKAQNTTALEASVWPSLHVVPDAEVVVDEDTRGYVIQRQVYFRLTFGPTKTPFQAAADLVADVQEAVETDSQVNGLAMMVNYSGETPYITEDGLREGTVLTYVVQYRRERAAPANGI